MSRSLSAEASQVALARIEPTRLRAALVAGTLAIATALVWWALPAQVGTVEPPRNLLRALGGAACLAAVVVAAITAVGPMMVRAGGRYVFISEVLAVFRRKAGPLPPRAAAIGSLIANTFMALGAAVFAAASLREAGTVTAAAGAATGLLLMAVVGVRLIDHPDPFTKRLSDFAHPTVAALFYLAALVLEWQLLDQLGPVGGWLAILHLITSLALILMSVAGSFLLYGVRRALWPVFGTRILLDVRVGNYAGCVRYFQWPATIVVGVALCVGALGW